MKPIQLVPVPNGIKSAYLPGGSTRIGKNNAIPDYGLLVPASDLFKKNPAAWLCTPKMAEALSALNERMRQRGSKGLRISDLSRPYAIQARERQKYEAWLAASSPVSTAKGFNPATMRSTYVARPGESNHGWGGAFDHDVYALDYPGLSPEAGLGLFWSDAAAYGLTPVISEPVLQSEAWHMDRLGPLAEVKAMFNAHRADIPKASSAYGLVARMGHILTGQGGPWKAEHQIQCLLLLAGVWVGTPDGVVGPRTLAGLKEAGVDPLFDVVGGKQTFNASKTLQILEDREVGTASLGLL